MMLFSAAVVYLRKGNTRQDRARSFLKHWKQPGGQRLQGGPFHRLEEFAHLLARRAVNARGCQRGDGMLQAHVGLVHRAPLRPCPPDAQPHSHSGRF